MTFRRATFTNRTGAFELSPYFKNNFDGLAFHHFVVERIEDGYCVSRVEFHPWKYRFSIRRTLKAARKYIFGTKALHVKN